MTVNSIETLCDQLINDEIDCEPKVLILYLYLLSHRKALIGISPEFLEDTNRMKNHPQIAYCYLFAQLLEEKVFCASAFVPRRTPIFVDVSVDENVKKTQMKGFRLDHYALIGKIVKFDDESIAKHNEKAT